VLGLLLLGTAGCSRAFYRHQADREVYGLVDCASDDPRWPLEGFTIEPDPRSRMFDPFGLDFPPMPPDDPTSHRLMQCVDCKRGWPCWHRNGNTPFVENPGWMAYLPQGEECRVDLDRDGAMEMALLHSREYQLALEDVYLSALDVTLQRFQFDTQFFGGNATFFDTEGRLAGGRSLLSTDTDLQMQRLFATGGELVVGVANSLVWQFAGPDTYSANTLLDFSLVQPLLRAGGRAVVLESLTDSERELLANIRDMERFRRAFYVQVVSDYLSLLEDQGLIRNQEANVSQLHQSLERFEAFYEGGAMLRGDVDRARQDLYDSQSALLQRNANHEDQIDTFKITLGLPPQLEVCVEDPLLAKFDLISRRLTETQQVVAQLLGPLRALEDKSQLDQAKQREYLDRLIPLVQDAAKEVGIVEGDIRQLEQALPERRRSLLLLARREEFRRGDIDPRIADVEDLDSRLAAVQREYAGTTERLSSISQELESFQADSPGDPAEPGAAAESSGERLIRLVDGMSKGLLELSTVQARARLDALTLIPIDLAPEEALTTARQNRRDWMNARADLVDTWRQIEVRANDLRSGLDVTFSGDINTTDNNPVQFRSSTGRLRVGLEFDAPLTRLAERNAYRAALIDYQRARRDYYAFEDLIDQGLRGRLRRIRLNQLNFEVQRAAVFVAISRVDESRLRLDTPPRQVGGEPARLSDSFVERLTDDLRSLLSAQNRILNIWVDQETQRMNLDLDLGTMQLDERGVWVDPGPVEGAADAGEPQGDWIDDAPLPPEDAERIPVPPAEPLEFDGE
jgi:outer membrane protein TolC